MCYFTGMSGGAIAGISVAAVFVVALLAACLYYFFYRGRKTEDDSFLHVEPYKRSSNEHVPGNFIVLNQLMYASNFCCLFLISLDLGTRNQNHNHHRDLLKILLHFPFVEKNISFLQSILVNDKIEES